MKPLFLSKSFIILFVCVSFDLRCYSATASTTGTSIAGSPTASTKSPASLPQTQGISAGKLSTGSASVPVRTSTTVVAQPKSTSSVTTPTTVVAQPKSTSSVTTPTTVVAQPKSTSSVTTPTTVVAQPKSTSSVTTPTTVVAQPKSTFSVTRPTTVVAQPKSTFSVTRPTTVVAQPKSTFSVTTPTTVVAQPKSTSSVNATSTVRSTSSSTLSSSQLLVISQTSSVGHNANGSTVTSLATSTQNPALTKTPTSGNGSSSTSAVFSSPTSLNPSPGPKTSSIPGPSSTMSAVTTATPFMSKPPLPPVANGNQNPGANGHLPAWATFLLNNVPGLTGQGVASIAKTLGINTESIVSSGVQLMQIVQQVGQYANMLQTVLSPKCVKDLNVFQQSLGKTEIWALKMLDAAGKIKPGILKGQKVLVGDYDECMEISPVITGEHLIDGNFCKLDVNTNFTGLGPAGAALAKLLPVITIHLCVPNSCNASDLYNLFYGVVETIGGQSAELVATKCIHNRDPSEDNAFWAAVAVLAFLVLMCVIGTIYGQLLDRRAEKYKEKEAASPEAPSTHNGHTNAAFDSNINKNDPPTVELTAIVSTDNWIMKSPQKEGDSAPTLLPANGNGVTPSMTPPNGNVAAGTSPKKHVQRQQEGLCSKLLLSFSVLKNGSKILNCVQGQGDLGCLHGIRVLSITWVILGHCFSMFAETQGNPTDFMVLIPRWTAAPLITGTLSVDSFFLLSGTLTSFVFLRQIKRAGGIKCKTMILYYVHRFWRLTPLYMIAIMIYTCIAPYMAMGPFDIDRQDASDCRTNWWHNILYVNNIVDYEHQCMGWSWYLANDMQFYVIAPIVLVPWAFGKKALGIVMSYLLLLTHLVCAGVLNYDVEGMLYLRNIDQYMQKVYYPPWCRIGPFAIGLLLGYVLLATKCQYKMQKLSVFLGWLMAAGMGLTIVYVTHDDVSTLYPNMEPAWNNAQASAYEAFSRPVWACALGWVIFACCNGYGGFVNTLLSWGAWAPLSRLTYGAYLFHLIIFNFFMDNRTDTFYLNAYNGTELFLCVTVLSFMVSFVFSVLVESPTLGLEKALLGGASAPRKKRQ